MKVLTLFLIIFFCQYNIQAQNFNLIADSSKVYWTGYGELGAFEQTGTIKPLSGFAILENGQLWSGEIIFDMTTISNEDKGLEKHLKDKDFFYVQKFPKATYQIEKVFPLEISGTLTLRGISQKITFSCDWQQNQDQLLVKGNATIDRTKFDIKYNSSSYFQDLGNYAIKNEFDINFEIVFQKDQTYD